MADSDVLILQDCCAAAASSADGHSKGTTEIIAACGFEVSAPAVGEHSFTRALIEELRWSAQQRPGPVSISLLHSKMLTRAKKSGNPRGAADGGSERRRTPIYIRVGDRSNQRCIELAPLAQLPELVPNQEASSTTQFSTTYPESVQSSLEELFPDLDFVSPKVLVSIALREGETLLQTPDATNWLEHFPAVAKCVHVEGVYRSDDSSTVLLLMLPVAVWDLLPGDPAISFVAFVRSRNLKHNSPLKADE